jgi:predicted TIM-barrel fold metal-dependent hydrolase
VPPAAPERRAAGRATEAAARHAPRLGLTEPDYLAGRLGTAATLRALDAEHGGGFFAVPPEAETDRAAADECFAALGPVIDVQTHLVRPSRAQTAGAAALMQFLAMVEPERWSAPVDPALLSAPAWASCVFGGSETSLALLTSPPGLEGANVIDNADIAAAREIVDRYAGSGRVLTHAIVHPNAGASELDRMAEWSAALRPAGWKVYTLWDPPERPTGGWFLDDEVGDAFLRRVEALGPRVVCAHKGIAGPIPSVAPTAASPRDIGPAARAHPDVAFVVYHSGYDIDPANPEGAHDDDPQRGVSRLVSSLRDAGVPAGSNVWAELGSTWFLVLRRPTEAAHVLGKLLLAVGEDRILWGTDSVWYGAPQPLIDAFRAFTIPERMRDAFGYPELTPDVKQKILGANAAALYSVTPEPRSPDDLAWIEQAKADLAVRLG